MTVWSLNFAVSRSKLLRILNPKGLKNSNFSPKGPMTQNLRYENLVIGDYEYVKISRIAVVDIRLWMKQDLDLHTNHL